jgi:hypothetical protein
LHGNIFSQGNKSQIASNESWDHALQEYICFYDLKLHIKMDLAAQKENSALKL